MRWASKISPKPEPGTETQKDVVDPTSKLVSICKHCMKPGGRQRMLTAHSGTVFPLSQAALAQALQEALLGLKLRPCRD